MNRAFDIGHTRDRQDQLLTCESGNRHVTRTESDGIAAAAEGL